MDLENQFHAAMLGVYEQARAEVGYNAARFRQLVVENGGVAAAKILLNNPADVSEGFTQLAMAGRLDISMEALVLKSPWSQLFTEEELGVAKRRLR